MKKIFIHKYKYSHDTRRKQAKRLVNTGVLKIIERNKEGILYECQKPLRISRKGKIHIN